MRPDRWDGYALALTALVVLGSALRVRQWWWARSLWSDEAATDLQVIQDHYGQLTKPLAAFQSAPIGWLWAVKTSVLAFGSGERSLRLVALLSGLLLLVLWPCWSGATCPRSPVSSCWSPRSPPSR